jgi:hypothetical protein
MNKQTPPFIDNQTLVTATTTSGSFIYNMEGVDRASIQFNGTLASTDTTVITLSISNDGMNFVGFAVAKTVTLTGGGTVNALFELGAIDYAYLKVGWGAPSAGTLTLQSILYGVATQVQQA